MVIIFVLVLVTKIAPFAIILLNLADGSSMQCMGRGTRFSVSGSTF